jgi:hypothetical protein
MEQQNNESNPNLERLVRCYRGEHFFGMTNAFVSSIGSTVGSLALLNYVNTDSPLSLNIALGSLLSTGIINLSRIAYDLFHGSYYNNGIIEGWGAPRKLNINKNYEKVK